MRVELLFQVVFAAAVVVALGAFAAAELRRPRELLLGLAAGVLGVAAAAAWVAFALEPSSDLAVAAGGVTACAAVGAAAILLSRARRGRLRIEGEIARAEERLDTLVANAATARAAELERTLARARADSLSLLAEQERRLADERRNALAEREREAKTRLTDALRQTQGRVEQRLATWTKDLEAAQGTFTAQLSRLSQRQRELLAEVERRIEAEGKRLDADGETHRAQLAALRAQLGEAVERSAAAASAELEGHAAERRRALHGVGERLRRRERELHQEIARSETEAVERIRSAFADVERRQVEGLQRIVERASARQAEAADQQFDGMLKAARESAAKRLSSELERAVAMYTREAHNVLAERLRQLGDAGVQRFEKRLAEADAALRETLSSLSADVEAERGVIEARLHELSRRLDEIAARADEQLTALRRN